MLNAIWWLSGYINRNWTLFQNFSRIYWRKIRLGKRLGKRPSNLQEYQSRQKHMPFNYLPNPAFNFPYLPFLAAHIRKLSWHFKIETASLSFSISGRVWKRKPSNQHSLRSIRGPVRLPKMISELPFQTSHFSKSKLTRLSDRRERFSHLQTQSLIKWKQNG